MNIGWQDAMIAAIAVAAFNFLKTVPSNLWQWFLYRISQSIKVFDYDPGYDLLCKWVNDQLKNPRSLRINRSEEDEVISSPGLGHHWFRFMGCWVTIKRDMEKDNHRPTESIKVVFWTTSKKPVDALLSVLKRQQEFRINVANGGWFNKLIRPKRPLSTVFSKWNDYLLNGCKEFFSQKDWYISNGVPWRKAYLFSGPPRTGKTSTVHALASELDMQIYILNPTAQNDSDFQRCLNSIPSKSIVLIEDLRAPKQETTNSDAKFPNEVANEVTVGKAKSEENGVTVSTLLNSLDGLIAPFGVIIIATTNYIDELPETIVSRFEVLEFEEIDPTTLTEQQYEILSLGQNKFKREKAA